MRTLAENLHISRANAYARVERLGVHRGHPRLPRGHRPGAERPRHVGLRHGQPGQADWRQIARGARRPCAGVDHIGLVGGEFDVVLLVRARDNADLRRLILDQIQGMEGVVSTRTLLVFEEPEPNGVPAGDPVGASALGR